MKSIWRVLTFCFVLQSESGVENECDTPVRVPQSRRRAKDRQQQRKSSKVDPRHPFNMQQMSPHTMSSVSPQQTLQGAQGLNNASAFPPPYFGMQPNPMPGLPHNPLAAMAPGNPLAAMVSAIPYSLV